MSIDFQDNGNLPAGIYSMTIEEFEQAFGYNQHREKLIKGLKIGLEYLSNCGCKRVFIDGSFVTTKEIPGDFDSCWDIDEVDFEKLETEYPDIVNFDDERKRQKEVFFGEFFPAQAGATPYDIYLDFFQKDRDGNSKGIVLINLK